MGSSCCFPATPLGMDPIQVPKAHHDQHQHVPDTRTPLESHPNRAHRCDLEHRTCGAHGLVPNQFALKQLRELYIHGQVASEHHHLQIHKQTKTQQTEVSALQLPSRKKKETSQKPTMISAKRIAHLAKKWQKMAAQGRKRLTWEAAAKEANECCSSLASKGHCAVYTADGARFEVPLACLSTPVFRELLQMSQEEFGFMGGDGRITLPCDAAIMDYAMCLLRRGASAELEQAFLSTMVMSCHCASRVAPYVGVSQQIAV